MSEEESPYPSFLWRRWDEDDSEGKYEVEMVPKRRFFEFCAVPIAGDSFSEDRPEQEDDEGDKTEMVYFLPPTERTILRNVPTLVFVFLLLALTEAEISPSTEGVSALLFGLSPGPLVWMVVYLIAATSIVLFVMINAGVIDKETVLRAAFVYGLTGVLFTGSLYATYLTLKTRGSQESIPHVIYTFPTLLFTLITGLLAYDLLLKGEYLFTNLGKKNIITGYEDHGGTEKDGEKVNSAGVSGKERYEEVKKEKLTPKLNGSIGGFRYGQVFAFLVLSVIYLWVWSFKGPLGTGLWSSLLLNTVINIVVLTGGFNFLIGIVFLRKLLKGRCSNRDGRKLKPKYLPFHPDRRGGFADIGKLAMRINVVFIVIGTYYVYRAYISGSRTFPPGSNLPFDPLYANLIPIGQTPVSEMIFWFINYIVPVLGYFVVVSVWFYYTFFAIHKQMLKGKKDLISKKQSDRMETKGDGQISSDSWSQPLGEYTHEEDWRVLYDAPEWPVNIRRLAGILSGSVIPLIASIVAILPDILAA